MIIKILLIIVIFGVTAFGKSFYDKQNKLKHLGGMISKPKLFWLCYTVYSWFFIPLFLAYHETNQRILETLIGWAILFWVRGILEMFMLYKWKNWRPPYGISHDILCFVFMLYRQLVVHPDAEATLSLWWIRVATICMVIEVYYAYAFFKLCKGKTMGKDGIWFADPHDPIYRRINLITMSFNWPLYAHIAYVTYALLAAPV